MRCFFIFILSLLALSINAQSQNLLPDSINTQLRVIMNGFMERYHSPGITLAVVHDQDIVFAESLGYADIENKIPATVESKYPILSVTKLFTATMLMQLIEKGTINLNDDVRRYVPELKAPDAGKITILQLATHTSGLPRNTPADINFTQKVDKWLLTGVETETIEMSAKEEFIRSLNYVEREYPEYQLRRYGDRNYSNLGYSLLGIALERVANIDYETYILNNICKPLGMTSSGFLDRNGNNQGTVIGYRFHNETFTRTPVFVPNSGTYAGGIYSTATDLAAFISLQFRNDAGSKEILSKDARLMMHAFNIGWKPAYPLVLHEGSMLGFRSVLVVSPEHKVGWVILTNTTDFDFSRINSMLGQLLLPIYEKKSVTDLNRYTGNYKLEGGYSELDIYLKDGQLYSTYMNESLSTPVLIPSGNNRFRSEDKNGYSVGYEFLFDDKSEKTILNLGQLMWVKTNKHTP